MSRSFLRLVVSSVLILWLVGFASLVLFSTTLTWTDRRARREGVFLMQGLLNETPPNTRPARLRTLQPDFAVPFSLMPRAEVERRIGRALRPGESVPHEVSWREEWYFLSLDNGDVLAAGPVNPTRPQGFLPVGLIVTVLLMPVLAALVAVRIQRQLGKVERASQALADGQLSARVDNETGPSSELAASFNAMAERVEQLVRSREELVQAVSHELGSPLSRLRFHLELLDPSAREPAEARLDAMARELDALDELVAELMQYVQSDTRDLDLSSFAPVDALRDLAELTQLDGPGTLSVEVECADSRTVHADRRLFLRAVENVLRNAATHAETRVLLEVQDTTDAIHVTVHDDGPGIPVPIRDQVTLPFFRPQGARERTSGGVGLGLAIVRRIVLAHGRRLCIEDSRLGGAAVRLEWPNQGSPLTG